MDRYDIFADWWSNIRLYWIVNRVEDALPSFMALGWGSRFTI